MYVLSLIGTEIHQISFEMEGNAAFVLSERYNVARQTRPTHMLLKSSYGPNPQEVDANLISFSVHVKMHLGLGENHLHMVKNIKKC